MLKSTELRGFVPPEVTDQTRKTQDLLLQNHGKIIDILHQYFPNSPVALIPVGSVASGVAMAQDTSLPESDLDIFAFHRADRIEPGFNDESVLTSNKIHIIDVSQNELFTIGLDDPVHLVALASLFISPAYVGQTEMYEQFVYKLRTKVAESLTDNLDGRKIWETASSLYKKNVIDYDHSDSTTASNIRRQNRKKHALEELKEDESTWRLKRAYTPPTFEELQEMYLE